MIATVGVYSFISRLFVVVVMVGMAFWLVMMGVVTMVILYDETFSAVIAPATVFQTSVNGSMGIILTVPLF